MSSRPGDEFQAGRCRLAHRATDLLAAACGQQGGTILLPALYCREVGEAIAATGCRVRCYELPPDLSAPLVVVTADVRVVIWHHPFGCYLPPPRLGPVLIEDACFTLRTVLAMPAPPDPELMVFSPRKEFGWPDGGVAVGRLADAVRVPPAAAGLVARWRAVDRTHEVDRGIAASRYAVAELGDRLPAIVTGEQVLTLLPLRSGRRDQVIETLRAAGVGAWCWQRPMPGCTPGATPEAWTLWRDLLLVPTPTPGSPTYRLLDSLPLEPWVSA